MDTSLVMLSIRLTLRALRVILGRPTGNMEVTRMIKKTIQKRPLNDKTSTTDDLAYWLSKTPEERIAAVEYLRYQFYGPAAQARLQRVARVVKFPSR